MAVKCIDRKYTSVVRDYRCEFVCDTDADFALLPEADVGSVAVSLESGAIRVVNTAGAWVPFAEKG